MKTPTPNPKDKAGAPGTGAEQRHVFEAAQVAVARGQWFRRAHDCPFADSRCSRACAQPAQDARPDCHGRLSSQHLGRDAVAPVLRADFHRALDVHAEGDAALAQRDLGVAGHHVANNRPGLVDRFAHTVGAVVAGRGVPYLAQVDVGRRAVDLVVSEVAPLDQLAHLRAFDHHVHDPVRVSTEALAIRSKRCRGQAQPLRARHAVYRLLPLVHGTLGGALFHEVVTVVDYDPVGQIGVRSSHFKIKYPTSLCTISGWLNITPFENRNTVQPNKARKLSFFKSCCFRAIELCDPPSASTPILNVAFPQSSL